MSFIETLIFGVLCSKEKNLSAALLLLQKEIQKQNSLKYTFLRGVVYGFGVFVGSAILVGVLIYILSKLNTVPIIGEYIAKILNFIKQRQG